MRVELVIYVLSFIIFSVGESQADSTPTDFEGWTSLQSYISLDDGARYQLYLETQPRVGDNWSRFATIQNRIGLNYNWDRSWSTMVGYAWTPNFYNAQYHRYYIDESRIWEQVLYKHELMGAQWSHRLRQEQRFIVGASNVSNRSRYQVRCSYGLVKDQSFGITAWDEIMVTLNGAQPGPWAGYDRNRFFIGPYLVVASGRYELGYLGEHLKRFGSDERWANALLFSTTWTF